MGRCSSRTEAALRQTASNDSQGIAPDAAAGRLHSGRRHAAHELRRKLRGLFRLPLQLRGSGLERIARRARCASIDSSGALRPGARAVGRSGTPQEQARYHRTGAQLIRDASSPTEARVAIRARFPAYRLEVAIESALNLFWPSESQP